MTKIVNYCHMTELNYLLIYRILIVSSMIQWKEILKVALCPPFPLIKLVLKCWFCGER